MRGLLGFDLGLRLAVLLGDTRNCCCCCCCASLILVGAECSTVVTAPITMEGGRVRSGIAAGEEEGEAPAKKEDEVTLGEDDDLGEEEGDADPLDLGELIVLSND